MAPIEKLKNSKIIGTSSGASAPEQLVQNLISEIKKYCKEKLTNYKCPKHIGFAKELPKSNVGKILRRVIKENDLKSSY